MKMKQVLKTMVLAAFCLSGMAFMACNNDDDYDNSVYYPNALVTIKTNTATGQVYLQLDDATTVLPTMFHHPSRNLPAPVCRTIAKAAKKARQRKRMH